MVFDGINEDGGGFQIFEDGCQIGMERVADRVVNQGPTIFGGENQVNVDIGE